MDVFGGEFTHLFENLVGPLVVDDGLGEAFELRLVEGVGDGASVLLSGEDEVGAALFVLAADFSHEEASERVAFGNPAYVGQLSGELSILALNGFWSCFHNISLYL